MASLTAALAAAHAAVDAAASAAREEARAAADAALDARAALAREAARGSAALAKADLLIGTLSSELRALQLQRSADAARAAELSVGLRGELQAVEEALTELLP